MRALFVSLFVLLVFVLLNVGVCHTKFCTAIYFIGATLYGSSFAVLLFDNQTFRRVLPIIPARNIVRLLLPSLAYRFSWVPLTALFYRATKILFDIPSCKAQMFLPLIFLATGLLSCILAFASNRNAWCHLQDGWRRLCNGHDVVVHVKMAMPLCTRDGRQLAVMRRKTCPAGTTFTLGGCGN